MIIKKISIRNIDLAYESMRMPYLSHDKSDTFFYDKIYLRKKRNSSDDFISDVEIFFKIFNIESDENLSEIEKIEKKKNIKNIDLFYTESSYKSPENKIKDIFNSFIEETDDDVINVEISPYPYYVEENKEDNNSKKIYAGINDDKLIRILAKNSTEGKFLRDISVFIRLKGTFNFLKQIDTYKVGSNCNSSSTMHTIARKNCFDLDNYDLTDMSEEDIEHIKKHNEYMNNILHDENISKLEKTRRLSYLNLSNFLQERMYHFSMETVIKIINDRKKHILPEWIELTQTLLEIPIIKYFYDIRYNKNDEEKGEN